MISQKPASTAFINSKQRTGNVRELKWDSGNTLWDVNVVPLNIRTIWDKDLALGITKMKSASTTFVKQNKV